MPRVAVETEATLKAKLVAMMRLVMPGCVVFRHEDKFTAGIPDISVTWNGSTTWLEVKFLNPKLKSRGIQALTTQQLALNGFCWYVMYQEDKTSRKTIIAHPSAVLQDTATTRSIIVDNFDHRYVANFVRQFHEGRKTS